MRYVPNALSISRVIAATFLFTFDTFYDPVFLSIYIYCAFTDFIDGKIARKYHCESKLGAALDSIGDGMTYIPLLVILVKQRMIPSFITIWLVAAILLALVGAFIALGRFKKFFIPHTYVGKLLGAVIFVLPIMVQVVPEMVWFLAIAITATINVLEILYINSFSKEAADVLSIFHIKKK
jgi:phosphatidylglycerophosphate synthase